MRNPEGLDSASPGARRTEGQDNVSSGGDTQTAHATELAKLANIQAYERLRKHDVKMPWERGPFAPLFSGGGPVPVKPLSDGMTRILASMASQSEPKPNPAPAALAHSSFVKKRISSARQICKDDELRLKALKQAKFLVLQDLRATTAGQSLMNILGALDDTADVSQVIEDCFAGKATGTIIKRIGAMWRFAKWRSSRMPPRPSCFQASEAELYEYICYLRNTEAAPTSASSFLESVNFCHATLGFTEAPAAVLISQRCKGAAHSMFLKKRKLCQAPPLTVAAVEALEEICIYDSKQHRRIIAGAMLLCVLACLRWSDCSRIESIWMDRHKDVTLVEAETSKHKTSTSKESKTRMLPYTAIGTLFSKQAWGDRFHCDWNGAGLASSVAFIPSWNELASTWASSRMTSGEATCWLREFLEPVLGSREATRFSSHSFKATVLTWAGMVRIFTREERTQLGHHVEANVKSNLTYSRDAQILLQHKVTILIRQIKAGALNPDATRAQRLSTLIAQEVEDAQQLVSPPVFFESESEEDDANLLPDHSSLEAMNSNGIRDHPKDTLPDGLQQYQWVAHKFTGVVHAVRQGHEERLQCGRALSLNFDVIELHDLDAELATLCQHCDASIRAKCP